MCLICNSYFNIISSGQTNNGPGYWVYLQRYLDGNSKGNRKNKMYMYIANLTSKDFYMDSSASSDTFL